MSRPTSPPRRRLAAAAAAALAALPACRAGQVIEECPGLPVTVLTLRATRTAASCQDGTVPADGDAACAARVPPITANCLLERPAPDCCFDGLFPQPAPFSASIAYGQADASAAFCLPRPGAVPYLGTRTAVAGGDEIAVSLETSGAVLASCNATCAVTVHHAVTGLLARDPVSGAVTGFTGESTELASPTPASTCTPCTAPCSATWALTTVP